LVIDKANHDRYNIYIVRYTKRGGEYMSESVKSKLAFHARMLFDKHGFHGTSLRELCSLASCKMPTLYYYYENKEVLFDEVVGEAFEQLVKQLWSQLPENVTPQEYAIKKIIQKKHLSDEERSIYRLAMKTWLGFEDCGKCKERLMKWEQEIYEITWKDYSQIVKSRQWGKFISRSITSIIQRIVLLDETISDNEIKEEIHMIFKIAMSENNKNERK
jgi:hypothetical protein